jgi:hypothetical protein
MDPNLVSDMIGKSGLYIVKLNNIHGSGWDDDIQEIMKT